MKKKSQDVRWKPVSRGKVFCSPACGYDCTHAMHLDAHTNAKALVASLDKTSGKGWKPHVWENLGWHYSAISACGRIKVHPYHGSKPLTGCTAFLGQADRAGGTWATGGKTPASSVRNVIAMAKREMDKIGATLNGL